jgi:coenzyme F420-0:L-glutamate ligase/coenzyme F420-1:gamma-L-glutamate ligase
LNKNDITLKDDDILVLAETVVAKAEGCYVDHSKIKPSKKAYMMAIDSGKTPEECQAIYDQSKKVIVCREGLIITETKHGFVCANSAIDNSNCEEGFVTTLPSNPDKSATEIKEYLDKKYNVEIGVILSDTQGRAFRVGAIGVAVGISGLHPCRDCRGEHDLYGQELKSTIEGIADELAGAASLLMGQADNGLCLILIRGYDNTYIKCKTSESNIQEIIRPEEKDVFRHIK